MNSQQSCDVLVIHVCAVLFLFVIQRSATDWSDAAMQHMIDLCRINVYKQH